MYFTIYYNMKLILPYLQTKLHSEIHSNAQNYTTKCSTCSTKKFIENLSFLCVWKTQVYMVETGEK